MSLKANYPDLANTHVNANRFGAISESHNMAISQIIQSPFINHSQPKVLDLGVGDGAFLSKLQKKMPDGHFTGIDVSKDMLCKANKALSLTTIEDSVANAHKYFSPTDHDLVLAHFINAYITIDTLFNEAKLLTPKGGYFSLITTTYDSFPAAQQHLAKFINQGSLMSNVVAHYYKTIVKNTTVAPNLEELLATFDRHGFDIVAHDRLVLPFTMKNIDELVLFGIDGTWFLNTLSIRMLPKPFLIKRLKRIFSKIFTFPYQDEHVIDVVLARKR